MLTSDLLSPVQRKRPRQGKCGGFTLLEVMVALTITAFVLGGLFSLAAGSKRLGWSAQDSLQGSVQTRARINFALLQDEYNDVEEILEDDEFTIDVNDILEEPLRKTQPMNFALQEYEITDTETDETIVGTRWIELELPR